MKQTPLYTLHQEAGARLIPFAGHEMPVRYPAGIIQEHLHTRVAASLFDVSHMGQIEISGPQAQEELERLLPLDLDKVSLSHMAYTFLLNEKGGVIDDLIITRRNRDNFVLVVNAGCKNKVIEYLERELKHSPIHVLHDSALLALQGPRSLEALLTIFPEQISHLSFMEGMLVKFNQVECFISRSGYTGEDGFEISVPAMHAETLARKLLALSDVKWAGLGARDSLRLEAGLCLYGHELTEVISPMDAGLGWSIHKARKLGGIKEGGFSGSETVLHSKSQKKRIGLISQAKVPVREGAVLLDENSQQVGVVTSGTFSPSLSQPIVMAYVDAHNVVPVGGSLFAEIRTKRVELKRIALPFVAHRYIKN